MAGSAEVSVFAKVGAPGDGYLPGLDVLRCALTDERFLRAHDTELVSLRVGQDSPGLSAGLPDVDPAGPERKKAVNLLIAVRGAAGEVKMQAVLDRLGVGDWHEAHADKRVLAGPDDDLVLALGKNLPAKRLRPEPGQAGQIVSVNDDVVQSHGHVASMRGALVQVDFSGPTGGVILHWNGKAWQNASRNAATSAATYLHGVSATSASNAWVVGCVCGTSPGGFVLGHWNGSSCKAHAGPAPGGGQRGYRGGRGVGQERLGGGQHFFRVVILRWNGTSWKGIRWT